MSNQSILREYLVALGFRVNRSEQRQTESLLKNLDKRVLALGKAAISTTTAIVAMATVVAKQMERMYYSARYADSTVETLQKMEYGARGVGLEAGRMTALMKSFAASIRSNPGLSGLLNSLGIKVTGRDKGDVMLDFVKALKGMPFYVAERYAQMFGMDAESLFNMQEGLEKLEALKQKRADMNAEAGLDAEHAAEVAREYMDMWREVTERAGVFGQTLMISALPAVRELLGVTNEVLKEWTGIVKKMGEADGFGKGGIWRALRDGATGMSIDHDGVRLTPEARARIGAPAEDQKAATPGSVGDYWNRFWQRKKKHGGTVGTDDAAIEAVTAPLGAPGSAPGAAGAQGGGKDAAALLAGLESKYDLPPGLLDRVWRRESNRGDPKWMRSPAGAKGHFGFMDPTAKAYGVKNPDDFAESADGSARMWRDLLKQYGGDVELAAAAYNWGSGNMDKYGLGKMPKETREYVSDVAGGLTVNQDVNINVHGVSDPAAAGAAVAREQKAVGADIARNFKAKVR
jgi:hypothetical protein